ncbi:MAG: hypothetical protein PHD72_02940 [Patescibacteria group bacterium]|nr:hypothetical protein [Patescibacteria group bacterium]
METGKKAFKSEKEDGEFIKAVADIGEVKVAVFVRGRVNGVKPNEIHGRLTKNDRDRTHQVRAIIFRTVEDQIAAGYGLYIARDGVYVDPKAFEFRQPSVFCGRQGDTQEDFVQAAVG